jgi:hypothetical protein
MSLICELKCPKKCSYQELFNYLSTPCVCSNCCLRKKKQQAIFIIRNFVRKILNTKKENSGEPFSLRELGYQQKPQWIQEYYHKLLDKHFFYHQFDIDFT